MVEAVGYIATVLNITGNFMLTSMNRWGWVFRLVVNVLYIYYAVQIDQGGPVIANHVAFVFINIVGWVRWRKLLEVEDAT